MTKLASTLQNAHAIGLRLVELMTRMRGLSVTSGVGMAPTDGRIWDWGKLRAHLDEAHKDAERILRPRLPELAWVHSAPVQLPGYTGSTAHGVALAHAAWALEQPWESSRLATYFETWRDDETGRTDWDAAVAAGDVTFYHAYHFHNYPYHVLRALMEQEYAKAARAPSFVPKISFNEKCAVEALNGRTMTGQELAHAAGFDYDTGFKGTLGFLVRAGVLGNERKVGYFWGPLAEASLRQAEIDGV